MNDTESGAAGKGIRRGRAGLGRPKGAQNKSTRMAKEAIVLAADRLGGVDRLVAWAQADAKNEAAFWTSLYPRLLPVQGGGDPNSPVVIQVCTGVPRDSDG
jgi:hypothetical protein